MDPSKKISNVSKETNHLKQMGINNTVKELLIQELKTKKNAHNKKMNYSLLRKKKTQWIPQLCTRNGLGTSVL